MKFEVLRENFAKSLGIANKAISAKASLPILQNVLIENDNGRLKLVATDLDKYIVTWTDAKVEGTISTTVPAKALYSFVSGLKDDVLFGEIKDNNLYLKTKKSKAVFNGTNSADYPTIDYSISEDHFVISTDVLKRAIDETSFSTSIEENSNPEWTGILFKLFEDALHIVGLDGYRLAKKSLLVKDFDKFKSNFNEVIIPSKNLLEILRLAPAGSLIKIDIQDSKSTVLFDIENVFFVSKILDGSFPNYDGVIPSAHVTSFNISQEDLYNAVKLSSVFAGDNNAVRLNVYPSENRIEVLSDSVELGNNKFDIDITDSEGENMEIAFKAKYVLDYLNHVPSDILTIRIAGQQTPAIFMPKGRTDYVHIAVPLQPYWQEEAESEKKKK